MFNNFVGGVNVVVFDFFMGDNIKVYVDFIVFQIIDVDCEVLAIFRSKDDSVVNCDVNRFVPMHVLEIVVKEVVVSLIMKDYVMQAQNGNLVIVSFLFVVFSGNFIFSDVFSSNVSNSIYVVNHL